MTGLYHYGRIRRTDWLPVGAPIESEQLERGDESKDEGYDSQDEDNEMNYETESDPEGDENDRVCGLLGYSMADVPSDEEEEEPEEPTPLAMPSEGDLRSSDFAGLQDD